MKNKKCVVDILDGNMCAAWAARLARVKVIPCFPITPQTEMIDTLAQWKADGLIDAEFDQVESEHSVMSAALGSEAVGARTFTSTSSQGLMLMHEMLPIVSGTRNPVVMINVSRGLSAPITLWPDHNDFLAMRDSGWIMICCETNQEVLDSLIMAFKIGEDPKVRLPVLVNMDGFIHSYTRTEVEVPCQELVDRFLPPLKLDVKLDVKKPMSLGIPVMADAYVNFRSQMQVAQKNAKKVINQVQQEWKKLTGHNYSVIEKYRLKNAKAAIVMMGATTTIAKEAVDKMREEGYDVGLLRLRLIRPWPAEEIKEALKQTPKIAVFDQNLAPGVGGILYPEVKASLFGEKKVVSNYIGSLGGKPIGEQAFEQIFKETLKNTKEVRRWIL